MSHPFTFEVGKQNGDPKCNHWVKEVGSTVVRVGDITKCWVCGHRTWVFLSK